MKAKAWITLLFIFVSCWSVSAQKIYFQKKNHRFHKCYKLPINAKLELKGRYTVLDGDSSLTTFPVKILDMNNDSLYVLDYFTNQKGGIPFNQIERVKIGPNSKDVLLGFSTLLLGVQDIFIVSGLLDVIVYGARFTHPEDNIVVSLVSAAFIAPTFILARKSRNTFYTEKYTFKKKGK